MGFIEEAAHGALGLTLDRIRRGEDHGEFNVRPDVDLKQQADLRAQQADGRKAEIYRQCLEHHGFVWLDIHQLPMLEGGVARAEGEWRHARLKLAFAPQDLVAGFPGGPADLDAFIRSQKLEAKIQAGKVKRSEVPKATR